MDGAATYHHHHRRHGRGICHDVVCLRGMLYPYISPVEGVVVTA